jgi:hypothetical protein
VASPHGSGDLLQAAGGDLTPSLFPHLDAAGLDTYLTAKLAEGYARANAATTPLSQADKDAAAIAWAYSRAYLAVWQRLSNSPAEAEVNGEAKRSYLASQIQTFKDLADTYLARHEQFFPLAAGEGSSNQVITGVATKYRY